jgi:hypothetical protein
MTKTNTAHTVQIANRNYTIHTDQMGETNFTKVYRITGARNADGALVIRTDEAYAGRPVVIGIAALERLNWWDINTAIAELAL